MCCWVGGVDWLCESLPSVSAVASRPFYDVECLEVGSSITVHKTETRGFFLEHYDLGEIGPTNISARSPYYSMGPLQFYGLHSIFYTLYDMIHRQRHSHRIFRLGDPSAPCSGTEGK